jgi:splicing factor U2AF subunit
LDRSKKSRRNDRSPDRPGTNPAPVAGGKWDEGFGGVYLPTGGAVDSSGAHGSNPALTLPTVGDLCIRKLIVNNIRKDKSAKDVVDEFAEAVLVATNNESAIGVYPVVNCQFLTTVGATRNAMVEFRTPTSANIALTVMQGKHGYKIKRPKDFPKDMPQEGANADEMASFRLGDIGGPSAGDGTVSSVDKGTISAGQLVHSTAPSVAESGKISVYGIPGNLMPEQIVRDLFSQFGRIKHLSFAKDPVTGFVRPGITGQIEYESVEDANMAESTLNNFPCGNSVIKISKLVGGGIGGVAGASTAVRKAVPASSLPTSVTAKIMSNPILAAQIKQGREIGSRPSLVVQLLNAVYPEDIVNDSDYNDIVKEVKEEAMRFGQVESIKIPRPSSLNSAPVGTGKIFVQFSDLTSARKFQQDMNGRTFDLNRVVCAAFYPTDRFIQGKYVLYAD